ncbi:MAG: hypothetical protein AAGU75_17480, partial [Bacillota bacterium]
MGNNTRSTIPLIWVLMDYRFINLSSPFSKNNRMEIQMIDRGLSYHVSISHQDDSHALAEARGHQL